MRKCYCCGADVPDSAKFCPKCGKMTEITQDLIDRARADDADAQTELYERTYKTVYSRIRAKVPDEDTAMDIMQESYLRAFTSLDQLQKAETFPSWLLTIANRKACDWYRKNGKENENIQMSQLEYENDDTISEEDDILEKPEYREDFSPDEFLDRAETGRLLSEILDTLPEGQRIILTMRYYDEMSLKEISEELGVNLSTVKTRLTAGKKKVEAKVLELEKSGTKLYSLGPVAFLVFLLHHAEMFAPAISSNTIIGLTAAGAGATAGGAAAGTAAHVTAATAAKTAAAAAVKGVSVKVAAIVAAAVVVVGGGVTTGVVVANNSHDQGTADALETPAVIEEVQLSGTPEPVVEMPSYEAVYDMSAPLADWAANVIFDSETQNSSLGKITLNTNRAVELAGLAAYYDENNESVDLSSDQVGAYLKKIFGSQYQMSDFTNTANDSDLYESDSDFAMEYPNYRSLMWLYRTEDGSFKVESEVTDSPPSATNIVVKDIVQNDDSTCTATVEYDIDNSFPLDGFYNTWSLDIYYDLIPDEEAEYGWAIASFSLSDEYDVIQETVILPPTESTIHAMVDGLAFWSVNAMYSDKIIDKAIVPDTNQAVELAGYAVYYSQDGTFEYFQNDNQHVDGYILPENELSEMLRNMFGSNYNLADFTNTGEYNVNAGYGSSYPFYAYLSAFSVLGDIGNQDDISVYKQDGKYIYYFPASDMPSFPSDVVVKSIQEDNSGDDTYLVDVCYGYSYYGWNWDETGNPVDDSPCPYARDVEYKLSPVEDSAFGWIITQITYKEFYERDDI